MIHGFKCFNCDHIFTEFEADYHKRCECHYWLDDSPVEELMFMACPECGCEDFEEVWINAEEDEENQSEEEAGYTG